jgi:hypothetical protein
MAKYTFVVLTNAVEGKDDAFDEWYTNTHLGDVLAVPGFVSAQRFKLTDAQRAKPPHPFRYLALYEIETNDLQKTLDELGKRSGTPAMVLTDTMAPGTQAHIYEAITPVVTPKPETETNSRAKVVVITGTSGRNRPRLVGDRITSLLGTGSGELLRAPRRIIPDEWRGLRPGCDTRWRYLDRVDRR